MTDRRSSRTDILTIMGAEFLATIFIGCLNACLVQPVAYVERTVFYRERAAGMRLLLGAQISTAIPDFCAVAASADEN